MTRRSWLSLPPKALPAFALLQAQEQMNLGPLLERLSEEAEVFSANITRVVGTETMRVKSIRPAKRFRPRLGAAPPEAPVWDQKELISEFGVSLFPDSGVMHELRKVQQVDGRQVGKSADARMSLALDMRSKDDHLLRKLLLDLKQYGLTEVATDFTLSLLMFRKRALAGLAFQPQAAKARLGADEAVVVRFEQRQGEFTVFNGSKMFKQKLQGEVWLRLPDGVPLRVVLVAATPLEKGVTALDEGRTDYFPGAQGYLLPASVTHRRFENRQLIAENVFTYQRFQRFSADAEIRFEEAETAPPKP